MRALAQFGLLFAIVWSSAAQAQPQPLPDLGEIMKKITETYDSGTTYEFEIKFTKADDSKGAETGRMHFSFKQPNLYRVEGSMPGAANEALRELIIVDDGTNVWSHDKVKNEYFSIPAGSVQEGSDFEDFLPDSMDTFMGKRFRSAIYLTPVAKLVREDSLDRNGTRIKCYLIEVNGRTWWVDAKSYRILREDWEAGTDLIAYYETIKLGEPIADPVFQFKPPAEARKVDPTH